MKRCCKNQAMRWPREGNLAQCNLDFASIVGGLIPMVTLKLDCRVEELAHFIIDAFARNKQFLMSKNVGEEWRMFPDSNAEQTIQTVIERHTRKEIHL